MQTGHGYDANVPKHRSRSLNVVTISGNERLTTTGFVFHFLGCAGLDSSVAHWCRLAESMSGMNDMNSTNEGSISSTKQWFGFRVIEMIPWPACSQTMRVRM
jgi:hypothetical protein